MERVAVAGLSLHQADVDGLERVKRGLAALEQPAAKALADHLGASEAVLLSTCNRCELVFARENGHAPAREDRATLAAALGLDPSDELAERLFLMENEAIFPFFLSIYLHAWNIPQLLCLIKYL
jgi:glutamyl-tRNA reductase